MRAAFLLPLLFAGCVVHETRIARTQLVAGGPTLTFAGTVADVQHTSIPAYVGGLGLTDPSVANYPIVLVTMRNGEREDVFIYPAARSFTRGGMLTFTYTPFPPRASRIARVAWLLTHVPSRFGVPQPVIEYDLEAVGVIALGSVEER